MSYSHSLVTLDLSERDYLRMNEALLEAQQNRIQTGRREDASALADIRLQLIIHSDSEPYRTAPRSSP
jgi:hypothetical protein